MEYELSKCEFLYDSFPRINFDCFGPGVLAAFCGAKLDNSSGGVWFFPPEERDIKDIHVKYDKNNKWVKRVKDLYIAGMNCFEGKVVMGLADLGGVMDVAATFCGSENLLMDLFDEPDEVKRLCAKIEIAWMEAFDDLNSVLSQGNPGYTDWGGLYSNIPYSMIQSDFCYMIGPDMFDEFVLPSLKRFTEMIPRTIYHLDGKGELIHLPKIASLEKLAAIQWIYGAGSPAARHWIDVYRQIEAAGKAIFLAAPYEDFELIREMNFKGLFYTW